jgi:DNA-directed RNA polymerase specialized sigma subunit
MTDLKEKHARLDKATTELQTQLSKFPYNSELARNLKELKKKKLQTKDKLQIKDKLKK